MWRRNMSLKVTSREKSLGVFIVSPEGSLDTITYPILEEKVDLLQNITPGIIIFDLEKLDYISSMGIRVIAKVKKSLKKSGGKVVLLNLQPQIRKVFDIIKVLPSEQIFESAKEMDRYLDNIKKEIME
jgi:anti-sigma B factor antagonist